MSYAEGESINIHANASFRQFKYELSTQETKELCFSFMDQEGQVLNHFGGSLRSGIEFLDEIIAENHSSEADKEFVRRQQTYLRSFLPG